MNTKEILNTYLKFYGDRGHKLVPNVSLIPENDPTLLFVNSGMFPLVPYLSGEIHPLGSRVMNVQRCLRFDELENIGDYNHTIAFHMIGNWSLGDYFKKEQLPWIYKVYIEEIGLDPNRIYATVFEGDESAPEDKESIDLLKDIFNKYGVEAKTGERIFPGGKEENWWKRGDAVGELGGPDSEIYYYLGNGDPTGLIPAEHEDVFLEIGNSVFMQYKKTQDGWEELPQKNVDFGGGLERLALCAQQKQDIYQTDNFWPIIQQLEKISGESYTSNIKSMRIIADHIRACTFLAMDGLKPSNKDQGYVLRRLLRRIVGESKKLGVRENITPQVIPVIADMFEWLYPDLQKKQEDIIKLFNEEEQKFGRTLIKAISKAKNELKNLDESISPENAVNIAFDLFQSQGLPKEVFVEYITDTGYTIENQGKFSQLFDNKMDEHKQLSRKGAEQRFKGGLADHSETNVQYHTATHLLHWALQQVLGEHAKQHGSNITNERLRFDFPHNTKLTDKQIQDVETLVNEKIDSDLPVNFTVMSKEEALKLGATALFGEKYVESVKVYFIGNDLETAFSKELCGGPHVTSLGEIGHITIYKQKSIGKGMLRVYAKQN